MISKTIEQIKQEYAEKQAKELEMLSIYEDVASTIQGIPGAHLDTMLGENLSTRFGIITVDTLEIARKVYNTLIVKYGAENYNTDTFNNPENATASPIHIAFHYCTIRHRHECKICVNTKVYHFWLQLNDMKIPYNPDKLTGNRYQLDGDAWTLARAKGYTGEYAVKSLKNCHSIRYYGGNVYNVLPAPATDQQITDWENIVFTH
ncbi:MAG: hypothetical protein H6550_16265 [Chitinophagales bacterium]|nr:hypothetical protein [Chitinophagales bacterium]